MALSAQNGPALSGAGDSPYSVDARLAWDRRALLLSVSLDLVRAGLRLPEGRLEAERMIDRDLPGLAKDAVLTLQVDSYRRVSDTIMDGTLDPARLVDLAAAATRLDSRFTRDMGRLVATFAFPLDAVGALYVQHGQAIPPAPALEWRPGRGHSGIVIVAIGALPVHGEAVEDRARACLFPRIFGADMRLVLDRDGVDPSVLQTVGEVGYASTAMTTTSGGTVASRSGDDPLLVMATELFGTARTDLVISKDDALTILGIPANRDLLRQGKVTIILDADRLGAVPTARQASAASADSPADAASAGPAAGPQPSGPQSP